MSLFGMIAAGAAMAMQPQASEVTVPGPLAPLHGTLLMPVGRPRAAVVFLAGSGPTARDGTSPAGSSGAPSRQVAEQLAARGIASVRTDKRGIAGSRTAMANSNEVRIADYAHDAAAWAAEARARTGLPCVWLLGHSEGGLVALVARDAPGVCGLILVSATGRPIGQVLAEQLRSNPANAPLLDQAMAAIARIEARQHVDVTGMHPALMPLFAPTVQDYLIDFFSYDPAALLRGYAKPVLIVQGLRDIQVSEADARRLQGAKPDAQLTLLPDVNHVLRVVTTDDRMANVATYTNADLPISPAVAETIASFLDRQHRGARR